MATDPSTVKVSFLGDASDLARAAKKAQGELDGVARHSHTASTAIGTAFGSIAGRAAVGVVGAAKNAAGSIVGLAKSAVDAASDMNESMSKSVQVFGGSAAAVEAWARDNTKNILLSNQAAIEGAATFGNLFVSLGLGQKPAADLSTSLVGLASDLSSFNNLPVEDALAALKSGILGEAEPLRAFGVSLSAARVEAEAYALGLAKPVKNAAAIASANLKVAAATAHVTEVEKKHGKGTLAAAQARDGLAKAEAGLTKAMAGGKAELTAAQKAQAAYSIILKDTALAQGDAARTSDGLANSQKILSKRLDDLRADLGVKLLPIYLAATQAASDLVTEFQNGTGTGGELRDALSDVAGAAKAMGDVLLPIVKFLVEHPSVFFTAAAGVAALKLQMLGANAQALLLAPRLGAVAAGELAVAGSAPAAAAGLRGMAAAAAGMLGTVGLAIAAGLALGELEKKLIDAGGRYQRTGDVNLDHRTGKITSAKPGFDPFDLHPGTDADDRRRPLGFDPDVNTDTKRDASMAGRPGQAVTAAERAKAKAAGTVAAAKATGAAEKFAADQAVANAKRTAAAEKMQSDMLAAAAKAKEGAARKLEEATERVRKALTDRTDHSKAIRDSLVSSNTVLESGISWTAKDLLSSFKNKMAQVKRFSALISALVHKGYSNTIVQQVASAGVDGGMATAQALASASTAQVSQFNGVQGAINKAAGFAGDRAALSEYGPTIKVELKLNDQVLATAVNRYNKNSAANGSTLAPR